VNAFRRLWSWAGALGVVAAVAFLLVSSLGGVASASGVGPSIATPYSVTFSETGLPSGTSWSVHVAFVGCGCNGVRTTVSSTTPTITIPITNGTYNYHILLVPGFYVSSSARGSFNVSGANATPIAVVFEPLVTYGVQFHETGLPNGTSWSVEVQGNATGQERILEDRTGTSNSSSISLSLPNGTYRYTVANVPGSFFLNHSSSGRFSVAGASPATIAVSFVTPPLYAVTFSETGLPSGTNWSVRVGGSGVAPIHLTRSSTTSTIVFELPSGAYLFQVGEVLGFRVNGSIGGSFTVTNSSVSESVEYQALAQGAFYPVAFEENGLPNGTSWAVTVVATHSFGPSHRETQTSSSTTVVLLLQNGTYRFSVHGVRGYAITAGGTGTVTIAGSAPSVRVVNFTAIPTYTLTFTESGLPSGTNWSVLVRSQSPGSTLWPIHQISVGNTTVITFQVPNGTYCYRIYPEPGYTITSGSATGSVTVSGASPPGINVGFAPRT
jgi:hypothetical protein